MNLSILSVLSLIQCSLCRNDAPVQAHNVRAAPGGSQRTFRAGQRINPLAELRGLPVQAGLPDGKTPADK